jgi:hypothetical protein
VEDGAAETVRAFYFDDTTPDVLVRVLALGQAPERVSRLDRDRLIHRRRSLHPMSESEPQQDRQDRHAHRQTPTKSPSKPTSVRLWTPARHLLEIVCQSC